MIAHITLEGIPGLDQEAIAQALVEALHPIPAIVAPEIDESLTVLQTTAALSQYQTEFVRQGYRGIIIHPVGLVSYLVKRTEASTEALVDLLTQMHRPFYDEMLPRPDAVVSLTPPDWTVYRDGFVDPPIPSHSIRQFWYDRYPETIRQVTRMATRWVGSLTPCLEVAHDTPEAIARAIVSALPESLLGTVRPVDQPPLTHAQKYLGMERRTLLLSQHLYGRLEHAAQEHNQSLDQYIGDALKQHLIFNQ